MKRLRSLPCRTVLMLLVLFFCCRQATAQATFTPIRIAVLAPLYIDSAFDNTSYKLSPNNFPRYMVPGLDFYNGAMLALDSLRMKGRDLDIWVYDTKMKGRTAESLAAEMAPLHFSLVIAAFSNLTEQKVFSAFSFSNNIPLVSATYPNDAYVSGNPFFIMLNSTLQTHVEGFYKYLQRAYPVGKFLYVTRKGSLEEKILQMYADAGKKTYPIKYKTVELPDNFNEEQLIPLLDSNAQNVIICGSLDETFNSNLIHTLDQSITFPVVLAGTPTWDGLNAVHHTKNPQVSLVYSTPFNYQRSDKTVAAIGSKYRQKMNSVPGHMALKGFESMFYFSELLLKYNNDMLNNLSDTSFKVVNNFMLQPVKLSATAQVPDYIENKKLYFITRILGKVTMVN